MPRQSRGPAPRPAASRPTAAPQPRPAAPQQQQTRQASTAAHPPQQQQAPPQANAGSQGSGLFGQMASTAAGVAVGSSIGHAVGGWFGGGSSSSEAAAPADQPLAQQQDGQYAMNQSYAPPKVCEGQVSSFKSCMDQNEGNLTICGWYLDQLKACQASASQY